MRWIAHAGERAAALARAVVPDPWVIAILLAGAVLVAAIAFGDKPPADVFVLFAFGFLEPGQLTFAFQMVLVLMTGSAIAQAAPVKRAIVALAGRTSTTSGAAALTAAVAMASSLFNWGLGLVLGALLVRETRTSFAERGLPLNAPLVGAAGYVGIAVWHGGLSGSAPLKVATAGPFGAALPVSETLASTMNIVTTGLLFVAFCALFYALGSGDSGAVREAPAAPPDQPPPSGAGLVESVARVDKLERSALVVALVLVPLVGGVGVALARKGAAAVSLDLVILVFFVVGLALHRTARGYANAFAAGASEATGIILQFPLYFGIIAVARDTGLVVKVADFFVAFTHALPVEKSTGAALVTYFSACVINVLVPSGGGQWAVQGPIILALAENVGVARGPLVMAFAYGDQTTNLLQPFWALPLLGIAGLRARDIMGYTLVAMVVALALTTACLLTFT